MKPSRKAPLCSCTCKSQRHAEVNIAGLEKALTMLLKDIALFTKARHRIAEGSVRIYSWELSGSLRQAQDALGEASSPPKPVAWPPEDSKRGDQPQKDA